MEIGPEQIDVLNLLSEEDGRSMNELSKETLKDNSSITRMVDILSEKNLLLIKSTKIDRRKKLIFISEKGKSTLTKVNRIIYQYHKNTVKGIDNTQLEFFLKIIRHIKKNIQEIEKYDNKKNGL